MGAHAPPAIVGKLAVRLAKGGPKQPHRLAPCSRPPSRVRPTLRSGSLWQASTAYSALADAADAKSPARYAAARMRVYQAEASIASALQSFALLSYGQT